MSGCLLVMFLTFAACFFLIAVVGLSGWLVIPVVVIVLLVVGLVAQGAGF